MEDNFERFTISQVGILIRDNKCLILKDHKTGKWLLPGGRADKGEIGDIAFKREMKEEIGFDSFEVIGVVDYDIWYTSKNVPVCAIVNLIENDSYKIKLSSEHTEAQWILLSDIGKFKFVWPNAKRMIEKGFKYKEILEKNEQR